MFKIIVLLAVCVLTAVSPSFADQGEQVIRLKDGSQIKGVLSGIENGIYTVKTPIIGDVHVSANDVSSITNDGITPAPVTTMPKQSSGPTSITDQQIEASQKQLMSNPQSMASLQEMMQDPEIMQALQDPALVQAVTNHDLQAVQNNPSVQKLIQNPKMQALLQKLAAQQNPSAQ